MWKYIGTSNCSIADTLTSKYAEVYFSYLKKNSILSTAEVNTLVDQAEKYSVNGIMLKGQALEVGFLGKRYKVKGTGSRGWFPLLTV